VLSIDQKQFATQTDDKQIIEGLTIWHWDLTKPPENWWHSSNGAERNAFDNVTLMMDKAPEHLFFHLRSVPLRVTMMLVNSPEHWNMFPALFPFPVPLLLLQFLSKFHDSSCLCDVEVVINFIEKFKKCNLSLQCSVIWFMILAANSKYNREHRKPYSLP
jgi:hypothetical protein